MLWLIPVSAKNLNYFKVKNATHIFTIIFPQSRILHLILCKYNMYTEAI